LETFWFNINREEKVVKDQVPDIDVVVPDSKKPAVIPAVKNPVLRYHTQRASGRGSFQPAEYNLAEIGRVEDTDSYCRQAFSKKVALMLKEGYSFVGSNPRTVKYIKIRLAQIARASRMSTDELLRHISSGLVRKSNTLLYKVRKTLASGGRTRTDPGSTTQLQPIAAYFVIPSETMEFRLDGNKLSKWRQLMPSGDYKEYSPRDIVHFHYDRKEGFVFGTPTLTPVVDDVRALRKIEENVELLIYQHLFPLFQYKVGTEDHPAGITESGEREIDIVRREIQYMPTEGGIVTPERHEIVAIGAESRALRAETYLEHFKKRVFSGLGVSAVDMGEGETANRATADNMSRNMVDNVKDLQKIVEMLFEQEIINELLLESTFGIDVLDEENRVKLKFKEIDIDAQIKKEAHLADQFNKDVVTQDEVRIDMGKEPITMPDPEESRAGTVEFDQYPEWFKLRWKMFEEPKALIQSIDEPYSPAAQAVAASNATEISEPGIQKAGEEKKNQEIELEKERTKAKVAVAKAKPRPAKKDNYINQVFTQVKNDTITRIGAQSTLDLNWLAALIRTQMGTTINHLIVDQLLAFRRGYAKYANIHSVVFAEEINSARTVFRDRAEHYINKLTENVINTMKRNVDINGNKIEAQIKVRSIFESVEFRTKFIEDVEIRKAESYGIALALRSTEVETLTSVANQDACTTCLSYENQPIDLSYFTVDRLPPYHASCNCRLIRVEPIVGALQDSVNTEDAGADKPLETIHEEEDFSNCPECGNTAIKNKNTGIFKCNKCGHTFQKIEDDDEIEDGASLEECVLSVKKSLRKEHPDWDADKVKSSAFSICKSKGKK
jgi:ribosomal protein L37AE/L43A